MTKSFSDEKDLHATNAYRVYQDSIIFLDPLSIFIIEKVNDGFDLGDILNAPADLFPHKIKPEKSIIEHCFKKCELLNKNSYTRVNDKERFLFLTANDIKIKLANLNQITFEVTDSCNLDCKYCGYGEFYSNYDERKNSNLDVRAAKRLIDYLISLWNSNFNNSHLQNIFISFYGGEPLLNMNFIKEIVDYINSKSLIHNHIIFSMTTNALLLKKHADYLVSNNFSLLISLDGDINSNAYRVFPDGSSSFDAVIRNINYLKETYPSYFEEKVNFNSVLHNKNSISRIYKYIKKEFNKLPSIQELNCTGINPDKKVDFFNTYQNKHESLMQAEDYSYIKKEMFYRLDETFNVGLFLHQYSGNVFHDYNDFYINKNDIRRTPTGTCGPFGKKIFVTANGKLLPCERIGHQYAMGKVDSENVIIDFEIIAARYNHYYSKILNQCCNCYNSDSCMQCIFNLNNLETSPLCNGFLNEDQFNEMIDFEMSILEKEPLLYNRLMNELVIEM